MGGFTHQPCIIYMSPRNLNPDPTLLNYPDIIGEDGEY